MIELSQYYNQSPDRLSDEKLYDYLNHLALERKLSWSSCHVAASAMIFFYNQVLADREIHFQIPLRKTPRRLPVVLSLQEAKRLVNAPQNEKHRVFLKTVYSAGLRLREATHLRVRDIDSARMTIRVESGKGLGGPGQGPLYGAFKKIVAGVAGVLPSLSSRGMAVFWPLEILPPARRQRPEDLLSSQSKSGDCQRGGHSHAQALLCDPSAGSWRGLA